MRLCQPRRHPLPTVSRKLSLSTLLFDPKLTILHSQPKKDKPKPATAPKAATATTTRGRGRGEAGARGGRGGAGARGGRDARGKKKTVEELDAEMEDYFPNAEGGIDVTAAGGAVAATGDTAMDDEML
jgi:THO complex subunit 4